MKTLTQALAWVYGTRNTFIAMGDDPDVIDLKTVTAYRDSGSQEEVPLIALEHRRIQAVLGTRTVEKSILEELDLYDTRDKLGKRLLDLGWTHIQLTANALNTTISHAKALVNEGIYSELYGIPIG